MERCLKPTCPCSPPHPGSCVAPLLRAHFLFVRSRSLYYSICAWCHPRLSNNSSNGQWWVSFIRLGYIKNILEQRYTPLSCQSEADTISSCPERIWEWWDRRFLAFHSALVGCFPSQHPSQGGSPDPVSCGDPPERSPGEDSPQGVTASMARAQAKNCGFPKRQKIPSPCWPGFPFPGNISHENLSRLSVGIPYSLVLC